MSKQDCMCSICNKYHCEFWSKNCFLCFTMSDLLGQYLVFKNDSYIECAEVMHVGPSVVSILFYIKLIFHLAGLFLLLSELNIFLARRSWRPVNSGLLRTRASAQFYCTWRWAGCLKGQSGVAVTAGPCAFLASTVLSLTSVWTWTSAYFPTN